MGGKHNNGQWTLITLVLTKPPVSGSLGHLGPSPCKWV